MNNETTPRKFVFFQFPFSGTARVRFLDPDAAMPMFMTREIGDVHQVAGQEVSRIFRRADHESVRIINYTPAVELEQIASPVPKHKKRRNQTAAYHERIQKKWQKRYGRLEWVPKRKVTLALPHHMMRKIEALSKGGSS